METTIGGGTDGYVALSRAVEALAFGDVRAASDELARVTRGGEGSGEELTARVFASALGGRLDRTRRAENLYLSGFQIPQIRLFELVTRALSSVSLVVDAATQVVTDLSADEDPLTLVDVGLGQGHQTARILRGLARTERVRARRVTVAAIEPSAASLDAAEKNVRAAADAARLDLTFLGFPRTAEALSREDWLLIRRACRSPIVNASFALHHVRDAGSGDARDRVLCRLHDLEPRAMVLSEPDVDHHDPDLGRRFRNCWDHFGRTFRLIDALPIEPLEKMALKTQFFGREIDDILGAPEEARCERHETLASWEGRLERAGFSVAARGRVLHERASLTGVLVAHPAARALASDGFEPAARASATDTSRLVRLDWS